MKTVLRMIWPLGIIVLLAILVLQHGGTGSSNPLSDQSLEQWSLAYRR